MFENYKQFSTMNVEEIASQMNQPMPPSLGQSVFDQPEPTNQMQNGFDFPKPKPEVRIDDFMPEAKVYVGLLDNGLKWGLPYLLKKVYNIPTEEECEHQYNLHQANYEQFKAEYEAFVALSEEQQDDVQKVFFSKAKGAYEEADRVWQMYPLIKKSVEQKGLDEGETKLLERALATWLYQNRDKVQNPMVTIMVVMASSVGSRFANLELSGAKQFRPLVVDELTIKQQVSNAYEATQKTTVESNPDSGGLLDESSTEG